MGRSIKYKTKEEQQYARKLRNKRYYDRHKEKLNENTMRKYYEKVGKELS